MQVGDGSEAHCIHMVETSLSDQRISFHTSKFVSYLGYLIYLHLLTDAPRLKARRLGKSNILVACLIFL